MSEELDRELEENLKKANEANRKATEEMQRQAMEMQMKMMELQQQAMAAGGMTPELMAQMQAYQQQMMGAAYGHVAQQLGADNDEEELADFIAAHPQPEDKVKYLGIGAFLTTMNYDPACTLEMMEDKDDYIENMEDSWGVDDRESLIEMLDSLLAGRAYESYNQTYLDIKAGKLDDVDEDDVESYQETLETLRELEIPVKTVNKCPSILAWDLERGGYLARCGAHVDYLTQDEAWKYLKAYGEKARENFADWTEYAVSMVMGRAVHMGFHVNYFYAMQELLIDEPDFLNAHPLSSL